MRLVIFKMDQSVLRDGLVCLLNVWGWGGGGEGGGTSRRGTGARHQ